MISELFGLSPLRDGKSQVLLDNLRINRRLGFYSNKYIKRKSLRLRLQSSDFCKKRLRNVQKAGKRVSLNCGYHVSANNPIFLVTDVKIVECQQLLKRVFPIILLCSFQLVMTATSLLVNLAVKRLLIGDTLDEKDTKYQQFPLLTIAGTFPVL